MFVQTSKTTINGKTYECKTVRESYRTDKGPRSRMVCNISKLPAHVQDAISVLLKNPEGRLVPADSIGLHDTLGFGGVAVLEDAWRRYRLDDVLSEVGDKADRGRLKAMVFSHLLFPNSKLPLKTSSADSALTAACGLDQDDLDEDRLYKAMDALSGKWAGIEKSLYSGADPETPPLVLYDLTGSYFDGARNKKLATHGYSGAHSGTQPRTLLALAIDPDGIPIHMEILRGNLADNSTLLPLLETMRRRFGITKAVFSFDGETGSSLNLEKMREDELDYVTRLPASTLKTLMSQLPEDRQPKSRDKTDLAEFVIDGTRYVVAKAEKRLGGLHLLTTSLSPEDAPKEAVFKHYRNLLDIEDAILETKSYLETRSISHKKDIRTRNHARICFLAHWISSKLRREWRQLGESREVPLVLRELQQIRIGRLKLGDEIFKAELTDLPDQLHALLDRLKLLHLFKQVPDWAKG